MNSRIFLCFIVAALTALLMSGCQKEKSDDNYIGAAVNGQNYYETNCAVVTSGSTTSFVALAGTNPKYPRARIQLEGWSGNTGTFTFDSSHLNGYGTAQTTFTAVVFSQSGSVTINSVSAGYVTGTFSFTCTDGTPVTNGSFKAKR